MADVLGTLARLRRMEAEQAKRDLAAAIAAEAAARRTLTQAQAQVAMEARVSNASAPGAFAAWLPTAAAIISRCHAAEQQAGAAREAARENLAASRAALKAAETLVDARATERRQQALRREEKARDDITKK